MVLSKPIETISVGGVTRMWTFQGMFRRSGLGDCTWLSFLRYNMKAASGGNLSNVELLNKECSGESIPDPLTFRVPLYNSPECETFVKDALTEAASGDYSSAQRTEVGIDSDKDTSDYNFGQPDDASRNGGTPWFSFGDSTLDTGSESSEVEVVVIYNDIRAVPIHPGNWYVATLVTILS